MTMTLKLEYPNWPNGAVQWESADGALGGVVRSPEDVPPDAVTFVAPCEMLRTWIGDVAQVVIHGSIHPDEMVSVDGPLAGHPHFITHSKWEERWPWLIGSIELHTWMGPEVKNNRTLLSVTFTNGAEARWLLVERAWLLGEGGATIERIAP